MSKIKLVWVCLIICTIVYGCVQNRSAKTGHQKEVIKEPKAFTTNDIPEMVRDTTTGNNGQVLISEFNNRTGIFKFQLNRERIEMMQDTTASGVRAHNEHYQFWSWHNNIEIKKDGKVIFVRGKKIE
ncbi:MAG TPA: hypothetical protein VGM63_09385 [Mucilaginibacter sp.]|jgi:hypothetical protein